MASESLFKSLVDSGTAESYALEKRIEGDAAATKNGAIGFAFKDDSGNVVLPQLNAEGAIPVTLDAGTTLRERGEHAGSTSFVDLATIVLALNTVYTNISALVSSFRDSLFQVVYVDDASGTPVETVLLDGLCGSGQFTNLLSLNLDILDTTGGTGVQHLKVKAKNIHATSGLRAAISCNEVA